MKIFNILAAAAAAGYVTYAPLDTMQLPQGQWECIFDRYEICQDGICSTPDGKPTLLFYPEIFTYSRCYRRSDRGDFPPRCQSYRTSMASFDYKIQFSAYEFEGDFLVADVRSDLTFVEESSRGSERTWGSGHCREVVTPPPIRSSWPAVSPEDEAN